MEIYISIIGEIIIVFCGCDSMMVSDFSIASSQKRRSPIYLFADSQLLFWQNMNGLFFLQDELSNLDRPINKAVYIGAANGDDLSFYHLFQSAMETLGSPECFFLKTDTDLSEAIDRVTNADLVLLAGGDVRCGWECIKPLKEALVYCYHQGTVLLGVSAGAVHLGALAWSDQRVLCASDLYATLGLASCLVGAHDERNEWSQLKQVMTLTEGCYTGLGIPFGGGVAVEYDGAIRALRKPVVCFEFDQSLNQSFLLPKEGGNKADLQTEY